MIQDPKPTEKGFKKGETKFHGFLFTDEYGKKTLSLLENPVIIGEGIEDPRDMTDESEPHTEQELG